MTKPWGRALQAEEKQMKSKSVYYFEELPEKQYNWEEDHKQNSSAGVSYPESHSLGILCQIKEVGNHNSVCWEVSGFKQRLNNDFLSLHSSYNVFNKRTRLSVQDPRRIKKSFQNGVSDSVTTAVVYVCVYGVGGDYIVNREIKTFEVGGGNDSKNVLMSYLLKKNE